MGNLCHKEEILTVRVGVLCIGNILSDDDCVLIRYWQSADIRPLVLADGNSYLVERECRRVGIITGPTRSTLARRRGIPKSEISLDDPELQEARVITGAEVRSLGSLQVERYLELEQVVFAELHNEQKYELLELLKNKRFLKTGSSPAEWIRIRFQFVNGHKRSDRFGNLR